MTAKLTLTFDEETLRLSKRFAKAGGLRLSAIVESFPKSITHQNTPDDDVSPRVK